MARSETANVKGKVEDKVGELSGNGQADGLGKKLLVPAAAGLGTLAATYAARKGPELLRDRVKPRLEEEGSEEAAKVGKGAAQKLRGEGGAVGAIAGKAADKLGGGSREKTRRLPIQRWTDVAAPIDVVYQKWTRFDEYPKFMHRVLDVEKKDRNKVGWTEKVWFSTRRW
jgi:hypothetical protein